MQNLINQATSLNTQQASFEYPSPALVYLADKAAKAVQEAPLPTTMRGWALEYARLGYYVFPLHNIKPNNICTCKDGKNCEKPGKHTRIGEWNDPWGPECEYYGVPAQARTYYQQASNAPSAIQAWWDRWPEANIGIALQYNQIAIDCDKLRATFWLADYRGFKSNTLPKRSRIDYMISGSYAARSPAAHHMIYTSEIMFKNYTKRSILDKHGKPVAFDLKCWGGFIVAPPSVVLKNTARKPKAGEPSPPPKWVRKAYSIIHLLPPAPLPSDLEELFLSNGLGTRWHPLVNGCITDVTPDGFPPSNNPNSLFPGTPGAPQPTETARTTDSNPNSLFPATQAATTITNTTPLQPVPARFPVHAAQQTPDTEPSLSLWPGAGISPQTARQADLPAPRSCFSSTDRVVTEAQDYRVSRKLQQMIETYPIGKINRDTQQTSVVGSLINTNKSEGANFVRRVARGWLKDEKAKNAYKSSLESAYKHLDRTINRMWLLPKTNLEEKDYIDLWIAQALPAQTLANIKLLSLPDDSHKVLVALLQITCWKLANAPTEMPLIWFTWNQVLIMTGISEAGMKRHRKKFVTWPVINTDGFHRNANVACIVELLSEVDYGHPVHGKPIPGKFELNSINATWLGVT